MFEKDMEMLEEQGLKRSLYIYSGVVNLSSNDYLGLSHHPFVVQKAHEALDRYGVGGTSSRLLSGTKSPHVILEEKLAAFLDKESSLVFSSGFHANMGIIPVIASSDDLILFDELCHASIIDGIRMSKARFFSFRHNDMEHLEKLLKQKRSLYNRVIIVTEGVFSMDGDYPPLTDLVELARHAGAMTYIDEAHSFGLFGLEGRGIASEFGVLKKVDIVVGTLSKTIGSQGGFIACSKALKNMLISRSRPFIYTTALPPVCAESALAALSLFSGIEEWRQNVLHTSKRVIRNLISNGFNTLRSESQIIPVWTGDIPSTKKMSDYLLTHGFLVPSIRPPTVPVGEGRVRLSITFDVLDHIDRLIEVIQRFPDKPKKETGLIVQTQ